MLKWYKVGVAVLLVLALLVAFGCAPPPVEEEEEEVEEAVEVKTATIGLLGSLTGPLRSIAGSIYAIEDYMTYINEQGGIEYLDPKTGKIEHLKFKWIMGDHAWDSAKCISLYERFKGAEVDYLFCNGSVPSVSIYALMARDHIPGTPTGCTGEPCFYQIEKPYLLADMGYPPPGIVPLSAYFVDRVWDKPGKPKIGVMAADVGSRRIAITPQMYTTEGMEAVGAEMLPWEFIPIAPVDLKIQMSRLVEEGADVIVLDHWGDSGNRVFIHNAIDLKLWEKDIILWSSWQDPKVSLAEPDVWGTFEKMGGKLYTLEVNWSGSQPEYDKYATNPQFWGLKLTFDICKKYRGCLPEGMGGGYYASGIGNSIIMEMVFKKTLEKYGYEGLTGETLRESLFSLEVIDQGGINPPFIEDYEGGLPLSNPNTTRTMMFKDGHHICDPEVWPFIMLPPVGVCDRFNPITSDPEWQEKWGKYVYTDYMDPIPAGLDLPTVR